ncbi:MULTISPECIES: hypothetical protein [Mesorhizobium]|uniref:hypothetical protein n=1 Tax=Mesorhizobium TaxID=68287 RepID=UPI001140EAB6|nr:MULTISPECIES: hypothetical protein [Mesorhizobium]
MERPPGQKPSTKGKDHDQQSQHQPEAKWPLYQTYTVRDAREGQKGFWAHIGSLFAHDDGEGGTLLLDALPIDGRVVLRTPKADE